MPNCLVSLIWASQLSKVIQLLTCAEQNQTKLKWAHNFCIKTTYAYSKRSPLLFSPTSQIWFSGN